MKMTQKLFFIFNVIMFAYLTHAQTELSRGHQILIQRGFQVQAQAFPRLEDTHVDVGFDLERFSLSNFTAVNFQWNDNAAGFYLGTAPGIPWGRWAIDRTKNLTNYEVPYQLNLISMQYNDEQHLSDPCNVQDANNWFTFMHQQYPNAIAYTTQAFDENKSDLENYVSQAKPDMLMITCYPFNPWWAVAIGGSPTDWYGYLQKFRQVALAGYDGTGATPIPYGLYLQSFVVSDFVASESQIRLNQFGAWAFGYKFASAFVYTNPVSTGAMQSILFTGVGDSTPTPQFDMMAKTNRQSRNIGSALIGLLSTDVRWIPGQHLSSNVAVNNNTPDDISLWNSTADPYITSITATNFGSKNSGLKGDVLVGYFKPLSESFDGTEYNDETYFMVVNGLTDLYGSAYDTRQNIHISFDFGSSGINSLLRLSRETGTVETIPLVHDGGSLYHTDLILDGGTGDLFKFDTGATFVNPSQRPITIYRRYNMGPTANVDGYIDINDIVYNATDGYGWTYRITNGVVDEYNAMFRTRGSNPDPLLDTVILDNRNVIGQPATDPRAYTLRFDVPNGIYTVTIRSGDQSVSSDSTFVVGDTVVQSVYGNFLKIDDPNSAYLVFNSGIVQPGQHVAVTSGEFNVTKGYLYVGWGRKIGTTLWGTINDIVITGISPPVTCQDVISAGYSLGLDLNSDCMVDFADFAVMAEQWLRCTDPLIGGCEHPWEE